MATICILYSTTDGQTRKICQRIAQVLEEQGHTAPLLSLAEQPNPDLSAADKIVLGASIRYGKHHPRVFRFVEDFRAQLEQKPSAFFTVNVVARKPNKNRPDTNPYMIKFLQLSGWRPAHLGVFAGKIAYPMYRFWDRQMIRFIMWLTKGPTAPDAVVEFTNWDDVDGFARHVGSM